MDIIDGYDTLLTGASDFLQNIPENDMIIFITSRTKSLNIQTENFLADNGIRYNYIIYDAPFGERILINDKKPSGLQTAHAINTERDILCDKTFSIDQNL